MKNNYDVIIIGAGPAGLKCAEQFINSNLDLLIIEKNSIIGPKPCGGGLTSSIDSSDIPENKTRTFQEQITLLEDEEHIIKFINPLKTIDRIDLGKHQLKKIEKIKNITVLNDTKVTSIKNNEVNTDKGIFKFRYLVGADGTNSIVRKHLSLKTKRYFGIYCEIPIITNEFIWKLDPKTMNTGYIWSFPHKNHTNIGIYFNPNEFKNKDAKKILIDYLKEKEFDISNIEFNGGAINYSYKGCIFGNIFLVGDAAGLTSKIWGEGISYAIISGKEIGKKILDPNYRMFELNKAIRVKKRQERMYNFLNMLPQFQKLFFKFFIVLMKGGWFQYYLGIANLNEK